MPPNPPHSAIVAVDLELHLRAAFSSCATDKRSFPVDLDGRAVGAIEVPCSEIVGVVRAPPFSAALTVPTVAPGVHSVRIADDQSTEVGELTFTLPALEVNADGTGTFAGGHVRVWVDDRWIRVDPPTALAQMGM